MNNNNKILLGYKKMIESFLILMHDKNPKLKMSFHTSFADFGEEYKEGKFTAQAHKQPASPEFIIQVNEDFELPYEEYEDKELICTSWRNNGYNGGQSEDLSNKQREELPNDFDVIAISGNPLDNSSINTMNLSLYVIGGCAKKKERIIRKNK